MSHMSFPPSRTSADRAGQKHQDPTLSPAKLAGTLRAASRMAESVFRVRVKFTGDEAAQQTRALIASASTDRLEDYAAAISHHLIDILAICSSPSMGETHEARAVLGFMQRQRPEEPFLTPDLLHAPYEHLVIAEAALANAAYPSAGSYFDRMTREIVGTRAAQLDLFAKELYGVLVDTFPPEAQQDAVREMVHNVIALRLRELANEHGKVPAPLEEILAKADFSPRIKIAQADIDKLAAALEQTRHHVTAVHHARLSSPADHGRQEIINLIAAPETGRFDDLILASAWHAFEFRNLATQKEKDEEQEAHDAAQYIRGHYRVQGLREGPLHLARPELYALDTAVNNVLVEAAGSALERAVKGIMYRADYTAADKAREITKLVVGYIPEGSKETANQLIRRTIIAVHVQKQALATAE